MVDNIYIPAQVQLSQGSVEEMTSSLRKSLGNQAESEIELVLNTLGMDSEPDLRRENSRSAQLVTDTALRCAGSLPDYGGVDATGTSAEQEFDDLPDRIGLAIHSNRLTGIASELNKLSIHHREIIDNLPIGLVALGPDGEILKWNSRMALYSGLDENNAGGTGGLTCHLPGIQRSPIFSARPAAAKIFAWN